jgi:hypothetical protein
MTLLPVAGSSHPFKYGLAYVVNGSNCLKGPKPNTIINP